MENNQIMDAPEYLSPEVEFLGNAEQIQAMFRDWALYFQEVQNPVNGRENTFFKSKYAPMDVVLEATRPLMGKHGLTLIQIPTTHDGMVSIQSMVTHKEGAAMIFPAIDGKAAKPDIQGLGSAITYLRRYSASAICGVVGANEDDDGNDASGHEEVIPDGLSKARKACMAAIKLKEKEFGLGAKEIIDVISNTAGCKLGEITDEAVMNKVAEALKALKKG